MQGMESIKVINWNNYLQKHNHYLVFTVHIMPQGKTLFVFLLAVWLLK